MTARILDYVDVEFPTHKDDLLGSARTNGAPDDVLALIHALPNQPFGAPAEVLAMHRELRPVMAEG